MTPAIDCWEQCYQSNWQGIATEACHAHPAKFSKDLIFRIVQHALEEGFISPGHTVIDPFAVVALGSLPCNLQGVHWIGVELEPRFAQELGPANLDRWRQKYAHRPGYGQAVLLQGDSRDLRRVLRAADACVSSPPYSSGTVHSPGQDGTVIRSKAGTTTPWGSYASGGMAADAYSTNPANLGNMASGPVADCLVSSPPWQNQLENHSTPERSQDLKAKLLRDGASNGGTTWASQGQGYGTSPGQLGNMASGPVEAVVEACIASPPFSPCGNQPTGRGQGVRADYANGLRKEATPDSHYGSSDGQLGNMASGAVDSVVSSPPWENTLSSMKHNTAFDFGLMAQKRTENYGRSGSTQDLETQARIDAERLMGRDYGSADGQLGQTQGATFWEAAKLVVAGVYEVLKPGGVAIWVVKSYCRDGKIVDFPGDWRRMCEHIGFQTIHEHHAMLVEDHGTQEGLFGEPTHHATHRKSFFRRLHEKKRPDLAINFEVVFCMVKSDYAIDYYTNVLHNGVLYNEEDYMSYASTEKLLAWRQSRSEKRKQETKERQAALGYRTPASINWPRPLLTEGQAMWIAAVLDCEGCISLGSYFNKQRGGYNFRAMMQVSMTRREVLQRLHELCAGTIHAFPYRYKNDTNRKEVWTWNLPPNGLRWLLPQIEPYLLLKERQATLMLEFLSICKRGVSNRSSYNPRAQAIRAEMAELNFRGIKMGTGKGAEPLAAAPLSPDEAGPLVDGCVASPPWLDQGRQDRRPQGGMASAIPHSKVQGSPAGISHYGSTPGQLGAMPAGQVDVCLNNAFEAKRDKDGHRRIMREKGIADPFYGRTDGNLGNLPEGDTP